MSISGVILSGGKNRRFGSNKAFVEFDGARIIDIALAAHARRFGEVLIVTNEPDAYQGLDARIVTDIHPNFGSLGGIYTGLWHASGEAVFVTACDMPFVDPAVVDLVLSRFEDVDIVVPRIDGYYEPLMAIYAKACLPHMAASIEANIRQIFRFFPQVRVREIGEADIRAVDPALRTFVNINTREDLDRALSLS